MKRRLFFGLSVPALFTLACKPQKEYNAKIDYKDMWTVCVRTEKISDARDIYEELKEFDMIEWRIVEPCDTYGYYLDLLFKKSDLCNIYNKIKEMKDNGKIDPRFTMPIYHYIKGMKLVRPELVRPELV